MRRGSPRHDGTEEASVSTRSAAPELGELLDPGDAVAPGRERRSPRMPAAAEPEPDPLPPVLALARSLTITASKVTLVVFLAWGLLFNFSEVRGSSMEPGIHDRDRILVDNLTYLVAPVARGDVVVLRYPLDPSLDYIKRIVGLPGDEILIAHGEVWVNDELLDEPYVDDSSIERWTTLHTVVREGHYFVLGDNRARSSDSREFGQVPFEYLRGKVRFRLWPPDRIGLIE
jgi:signal peptidase I